jgi:hypothetical protein
MPWELGFFDGRWGRRLIGLYDLDERDGTTPAEPAQPNGEIGLPEFMQIYSELTPATLEGFLNDVRSPRALSDRADVDIDRWANLAAGMMRDPVNVSIDALQFWMSYQQAFWQRALGTSGLDLDQSLLGLTEAMCRAAAPLARMMQPQAPGMFDALVQRQAEASADAQRFSQ